MSKGKVEQGLDNLLDLLISFAETYVPAAGETFYSLVRAQHDADDVNLVSDILRHGTALIRRAYDENPTAEALQEAEKLAKRLMKLESYEDVFTGASKKAFQELRDMAERRASNAQQNYESAVNRQNKAVANAQNRAATAQSLASQPNTRNLRAIDDALGTDYSKYAGFKSAVTSKPITTAFGKVNDFINKVEKSNQLDPTTKEE